MGARGKHGARGGAPTGALGAAIDAKWGSFASFKTALNAAGAGVQGSGWAWLAHSKAGGLGIVTCANQDPVSVLGLTPLLGIDVWEHAYYLQYKNVRPDYVKAIWEIVNWKNVGENLAAAKKA